jgi:hypothetical protein
MDTERTPKSRSPLAVRVPLSYIDGVNEQRAGGSLRPERALRDVIGRP